MPASSPPTPPSRAVGALRRSAAALLCLVAVGPATARAQDPSRVRVRSWDVGPDGPLQIDRGAVGLWQRLRKLTTTGSVLYTTGHPDDEEAGVLTLLSRGRGVRTALLTLNRGEGGANAIGPELFDALGLIRSEELRLAGRWYGLDDQYFTTAIDYGFSKTLDEAMRSWDREAVIGDMVRILRTDRPLVVISRWHGSERDGHGHHQAAGVLTPEAVRAAADPARFPEQITREGLAPWRVRKVYRGRLQPGERAHLELDPYVTSPWLGASYADVGSYGLSLQRSQTSGGRRGGRGGAPARYERLTPPGTDREEDVFDGLDTSLPGIFALLGEPAPPAAAAALAEAEGHVARALADFSLADPGAVAPSLARARGALDRALAAIPTPSDAAFLVGVERRELDEALIAALGLEVEAVATPAGAGPDEPMGPAVPGQRLDVHVSLGVAGHEAVDLIELRIDGRGAWSTGGGLTAGRLEPGGHWDGTRSLTIPSDASPSRPWFRRASIADNAYEVLDSADIHLGESRPRATAVAVVAYAGQRLEVAAPVRTLESLAPYGTVRHALTVAPALSVRASPSTVVVTPGTPSVEVAVEVVSSAPSPIDAAVRLELPAGWAAAPAEHRVRFARAGETERAAFVVTPPPGVRGPQRLRAVARSGDRAWREGFERIAHRDLEPAWLYREATVDVVPVDVAIAPGLRVGYVMGVGDDVPAAIAQLGAEVHLLDAADLARGDLAAYEAVVVGTRAYAVRPDLVANNRRLVDWARAGGNLVVLYQTQEYTPETQAPFPATLPQSAEEVSEEDAPVTILAPGDLLLSTPNRIGPADFDGWIEQRGSKFFATWSDAYTPLVETHDTGQAPQRGVWLTARVGEGRFTYAALALHRQLPYGVPGAYRILANLLSPLR